jgi:GT2 family glycosyltransferase
VDPANVNNPNLDASIIIVSFNTRDILQQCLQSVIREAAHLDVEIFVVDNCSADGSVEMVEREFPSVHLMRSEINLGFGVANNLALKEARGAYIVLLNSDAFFQPFALQRAIDHMNENPDCGLGGGLLVGRDGTPQPSARAFHSLLGDLIVLTGLAAKYPQSKVFGSFDRTWADANSAAMVDWVPGAFCIIRPKAIQEVGSFDPRFFLYYEEVDLCRRIKSGGYSIWYWPDVVIVHIGGESSRTLKSLDFSSQAAQIVMWRMRSTLLYYRKHHGMQALLAKWLEMLLYRLTVIRNRLSRDEDRRARGRRYLTLIALMQQAWKDTDGGRISPPSPW